VALLPLLACTLAVSLAGDHRVAAALAADAAGRGDQVERGQAVLDPFGMMLDAARVEQKARLRRAPHLGRAHDHRCGNARNGRRMLRCVPLYDPFDRIPSRGMRGDELAVDPAAL